MEWLPLSALLSQVLVAFIIEFDNEFEHRVPHRTTKYGSSIQKPPGGSHSIPYLVSMAMWLKFMRFVPDDGIAAGELCGATGLDKKHFRLWLTRMSKWWGYVSIDPELIVRPTSGGRQASEVWRGLAEVIEERWQERFGKKIIGQLRDAMQTLVQKFEVDLPESLPILGYDLLSHVPEHKRVTAAKGSAGQTTLPVLLSKVLLQFAIEFEGRSGVSLAIAANALRVAGDEGVRVRDIPRLAGVSKEAIAMPLDRIEKRGWGVVEAEAGGSRVKVLVLTPAGRKIGASYGELTCEIEREWRASFGEDDIAAMRELLEQLVGDSRAEGSPLFQGLQPYPDGWRAKEPPRAVLPHYPMFLHRGGFPDGS